MRKRGLQRASAVRVLPLAAWALVTAGSSRRCSIGGRSGPRLPLENYVRLVTSSDKYDRWLTVLVQVNRKFRQWMTSFGSSWSVTSGCRFKSCQPDSAKMQVSMPVRFQGRHTACLGDRDGQVRYAVLHLDRGSSSVGHAFGGLEHHARRRLNG